MGFSAALGIARLPVSLHFQCLFYRFSWFFFFLFIVSSLPFFLAGNFVSSKQESNSRNPGFGLERLCPQGVWVLQGGEGQSELFLG